MAVKSYGLSHSSSLMTEKLVLDELKHCPQIIRCFGETVSCENGENLYNVLLEYASGGSLADKLKVSDDHRLPELQVRQYTKALLRGLNYIHKFGYVHCDIKLQNILLCNDGNVKIADFKLAKWAGEKGEYKLRGTPMYMSPEMVAGSEQGTAADIWVLGCVVSEMVSGSPTWSCSNMAALLIRISVGQGVPKIPGDLSREGKYFLEKCFVKDPRERWTTEMLLDHPFVGNEDFPLEDESRGSTSPRCPFNFQERVSSSITSLSLPSQSQSGLWFFEESISRAVARLLGLINEQSPNWSFSNDWVTVR